MSRFIHPNLHDVPLASVLHALSDPMRLEIVRRLSGDLDGKGDGLACNCAAPEELPRATMSNHFTMLRNAGLIESRKDGTKVVNQLRRDEIQARFPGLLDAILHADVVSP
ncbi:MAG: ArsR/SmtB family transcription factor [Sphingomicrobium sp.]